MQTVNSAPALKGLSIMLNKQDLRGLGWGGGEVIIKQLYLYLFLEPVLPLSLDEN